MNENQDAGSDVEDDGIDIQAVQFQLTHDLDKLQKISANRQFSYRDVNILKIIICSGLYPQVYQLHIIAYYTRFIHTILRTHCSDYS